MQLKEFSLISPVVESGTILKALETAIPSDTIEIAIVKAKASEDRKRALPSHLVVCLIIAMSLWSSVSMRTVLKNMVDGLSEGWVKVGKYWRVPCKSSITEARQRIGCEVRSSPVSSCSASLCHSPNSWSFFRGNANDGGGWNSIRYPGYTRKCQSFWIPRNTTWDTSCFSKSTFGIVD